MSDFKHAWLLFLARFRLSQKAVCKMSQGRGLADDFHDYHDTEDAQPVHFLTLRCRFCGKEFTI